MERATELERAVLALVPPPPAPVTPTKRVPAPAITFVDLETTGGGVADVAGAERSRNRQGSGIQVNNSKALRGRAVT